MSEISVLAKEVLCSIAIIPCNLEELIERDFLKRRGGVDQYTACTLLNMNQKYWFEDKNGIFHIYKKYRDDVKEHIFK